MAAALLLLYGCASPIDGAECAAPRAAIAAPATGELKLISWNVHGLPFDETLGERVDRIAAEILLRRPDLVLLQEAWMDGSAERFDCRLRGEYARVPDPAGVAAGPLSYFGHRRGGLLAMVRRDSPWQLDASVVPQFVEYDAAGPLHRIFDERDGIAGKGIQRFAVGDGDRRVVVLHTHLQARYADRRYEDVRAAQIRQLLRLVEKPGGDVVLVAGDFNTSPGEPALYGALTETLRDLTATVREQCRCGTLAGARRTDAHWIDYVLARANASVTIEARADLIRNRAPRDPFSDHHGIWVEKRISR